MRFREGREGPAVLGLSIEGSGAIAFGQECLSPCVRLAIYLFCAPVFTLVPVSFPLDCEFPFDSHHIIGTLLRASRGFSAVTDLKVASALGSTRLWSIISSVSPSPPQFQEMSASDSPTIEVSHLPSAASFFAEILQPLGISYLSASNSRVNFGWVSPAPDHTPQPHVVLSLQQSPTSPVQRSSITLLANSRGAVDAFYKKGWLASNWQKGHTIEHSPAETRARVRDLDGNMLEAVYSPRAPGALPRRRTLDIETASTPKEARRVLQWQQDVARSVALSESEHEHSPPPPSLRGAGPPPGGDVMPARERDRDRDGFPIQFRRSETFPQVSQHASGRTPRLVTRETVRTERFYRSSEGEGGGRSMSGIKLVGTLLVAAAGAAIAYAAVRSDSPPRDDGPRRASHGDHPVQGYSQVYRDPRDVPHVDSRGTGRISPRSYIGMDPRQTQYVAQYMIRGPPPTRAHDWARIEERSHASYRGGRSELKQVVKERSRSESGSSRYSRPPPVLPRSRSPHSQSQASRRSHRSHHSEERGTSRFHKLDGERESYVSVRSQRTERPDVRYDGGISTTTIRIVPKDERRRGSSARHIPLPESVVGGPRYAESVAPSDSVSSVGSKRERERLRERMRERW